jgi:hypothetical protein
VIAAVVLALELAAFAGFCFYRRRKTTMLKKETAESSAPSQPALKSRRHFVKQNLVLEFGMPLSNGETQRTAMAGVPGTGTAVTPANNGGD